MQKFKTTADRFRHEVGTVVYLCRQHDYGAARDDSRSTGVEHVSVTEREDGGYPFFTIPRHQLEPIQ